MRVRAVPAHSPCIVQYSETTPSMMSAPYWANHGSVPPYAPWTSAPVGFPLDPSTAPAEAVVAADPSPPAKRADVVGVFNFVKGSLEGGLFGTGLASDLAGYDDDVGSPLRVAPQWIGYDVGHIPELRVGRKTYLCRVCGQIKRGHTCPKP